MFGRTILLSDRSWGVCPPVKLLNTVAEDDVTGLLAALAVRSSVYCVSDLGAPWGFEVAGADVAKFHVVLDGGCWLRLARTAPVRLERGDLAILPRGEQHTVSDQLDSPVTGLDELIAGYLAPPGFVAAATVSAPGCCVAGSRLPALPPKRCWRCCRR